MANIEGYENKSKCGYEEFTFYNKFRFKSKFNLLVLTVVIIISLFKGSDFLRELFPNKVVLCVISLLSLCLILNTLLTVVKETLYVITPIGVQFTSTNLIGKETVLFIPWHTVQNFVIVEVIVGQQIFFYLAIQTIQNNKEGLIILFKDTRPRLINLEKMYRVIVRLC